MRLLVVPRIECVAGDRSLTIRPLTFMRACLLEDPKCYFIVVVHEEFKDKSWLDNYGLSDYEKSRIELLYVPEEQLGIKPSGRRFSYFVGTPLAQYIGPMGQARFVDAILTECFPSNAAIRFGSMGFFNRGMSRKIPMIGWACWTATRSWSRAVFNEFDPLVEMNGSLVCDKLIFQSKRAYQEHLKDWRIEYNAATINRLTQKCEVIPTGVMFDKIPCPERDLSKKPVGMWSGYFKEDFVDAATPLINALRMGKLSELHLNFGLPRTSSEAVVVPAATDKLHVHEALPQPAYHKLIGKADLFVALATEFIYSTRWAEIMAAGALPIVSKEIKDCFLWEEYPFVATTRTVDATVNAALLLRQRKPEEWTCLVDRVRQHIQVHHNAWTQMPKIQSSIKSIIVQSVAQATLSEFQVAVNRGFERLRTDDVFTHHDMCRYLLDFVKTDDLEKNAMIPPGVVRWSILRAGAKDIGDQEPVYKVTK